jgi:hypothetical protein
MVHRTVRATKDFTWRHNPDEQVISFTAVRMSHLSIPIGSAVLFLQGLMYSTLGYILNSSAGICQFEYFQSRDQNEISTRPLKMLLKRYIAYVPMSVFFKHNGKIYLLKILCPIMK